MMTRNMGFWYFNGEGYSMMEDLIGTKIGKLTVKEYLGKRGRNPFRDWYKCICDCGNECEARRDHLREHRKCSCGRCFKIVMEEDYCRYYCTNGEFFIFDIEDLDLVKRYRWVINNNSCGEGYAEARMEDGRLKLLARLLLGVDGNVFVDHINGNKLDNRRSNLRLASPHENNGNAGLRNDNTSGFKGVCFRKDTGRYQAYITMSGKTVSKGTFDTPEEAARAYDEAARYYFGEFACVNFPRPGEQGCRRNQPAEEQAERMAV